MAIGPMLVQKLTIITFLYATDTKWVSVLYILYSNLYLEFRGEAMHILLLFLYGYPILPRMG